VTVDHYAGAGERWAAGATLVYGPIAAALVAFRPDHMEGHTVLDVGAGTGVAGVHLAACGARPVAIDLSFDMLAWNAPLRPPAVVADIRALPLADGCVDDAVAAFVLNHLVEPAKGFAELLRVTRPGGAFLACVYSNLSRSEARDRVDEVAQQQGWRAPDWYLELKTRAAPLLGSADDMAGSAAGAGLVDITVEERGVNVGVTTPEQLVDYRFGQAQFAAWLDHMGAERAGAVRRQAAEAVSPMPIDYRPVVVFLSAHVPC
jgi:SAM-dependent methyltransferase